MCTDGYKFPDYFRSLWNMTGSMTGSMTGDMTGDMTKSTGSIFSRLLPVTLEYAQ
jgi:hypothetical protein